MRIRLLAVLSTALGSLAAQGPVQFIATYGGTGQEAGYQVEVLPDSSLVVLGGTTGFGVRSEAALMFEVDINGNVVWAKTYEAPGGTANREYGASFVPAGTGYSISMRQDNGAVGSQDFELFSVDAAGGLLGPANDYGTSGEEFGAVMRLSRTTPVLGGSIRVAAGNHDMATLAVDPTTGQSTLTTYGGLADEFLHGMSLSGGSALLFGHRSGYRSSESGIIVNTAALGGSPLWVLDVDNPLAEDRFYSGIFFGGLVRAVGYTTYPLDVRALAGRNILLQGYNGGGLPQRGGVYGGAGQDEARQMIFTDDGGYAVLGVTNSFHGRDDLDLLLIKFDSGERLEWARTYGGLGDEDVVAGGGAIDQLASGGFVLVGTTDGIPPRDDREVLLIRTDPMGVALGDPECERDVTGEIRFVRSRHASTFVTDTSTTTPLPPVARTMTQASVGLGATRVCGTDGTIRQRHADLPARIQRRQASN